RASIDDFVRAKPRVPLPSAEIHLGGLLIDPARLLENGRERDNLLAQGQEMLQNAERDIWDTYERAYLELEWAAYCRTQGQTAKSEDEIAGIAHKAEKHIARARHYAHASD